MVPGYECIDSEEETEVLSIFKKGGGVLFRQGFETLRENSWKTKNFERDFAAYLGVTESVAVSSGTAALRVALAALGIKRGDVVITQAFTFVATVEAIIESGAQPVCVDIDETLNMSPDALRKSITQDTRAVIVVHMLGTPCRMKEIIQICHERSIPIIEDTAWGCGGMFDGYRLGTLADIGCFSFDFAKTITTGEGGMVVTNSKQLIEKAKAYHDHGHENNPKLPRWEDSRVSSGFNFRMSELQAAVGIAQLKKLNWIVDSQRKNAESILNKVSEIGVTGIKPRVSPAASFETFDAVVFRSEIVPAREVRDALLKFSISTKILPEATTWHFAGDWDHLEFIQKSKLKDKKFLEISRNLLSKHFAIPNFVYLPQGFLSNLEKAFLALREKYGA